MSTAPDTTKTQLVERQLVEAGDVETVYVALQPKLAGHPGPTWVICINFGWGSTVVARADYPHHANGIAHALAGSMDCDLDLGGDLTAALEARDAA